MTTFISSASLAKRRDDLILRLWRRFNHDGARATNSGDRAELQRMRREIADLQNAIQLQRREGTPNAE